MISSEKNPPGLVTPPGARKISLFYTKPLWFRVKHLWQNCFSKTFEWLRHRGGGCLGPLGCLGAVVTGPSKGGLFSGGGGLFRGLFRAGR